MNKFSSYERKEFIEMIQNEKQAFDTMEMLYEVLQNEEEERSTALDLMVLIMQVYPIVKMKYYYNPREHRYVNRIYKVNHSFVPSPAPVPTIEENIIPKIYYKDDQFAGLYFIGQIGYNPIMNKKVYFVKVGQSENISRRIKTYLSYNPLIYYNHTCLPVENSEARNIMETNCHCYLRKFAIAMGQNTSEMFQVDEEVYYQLCKQFSDINTFNFIARGEL